MKISGLRLAVVIVLMALGSGCSSFNKRWDEAVVRPVPIDNVTGPWEGRWQSHKGHGGGKLRCVIDPAASTDPHAPYVAHFRATFWGIFKGGYSIPLTRQEGTPITFAGEKDLGWLAGGNYTYRAEITPSTF